MIKASNILGRTLCLLLMIHLLAMSVSNDYFLNLINKSSIKQVIDIEKDSDKGTKDKNVEFDDFDDVYLIHSSNILFHHNSIFLYQNLSSASFQYLHNALPQCIDEILIPPPRS